MQPVKLMENLPLLDDEEKHEFLKIKKRDCHDLIEVMYKEALEEEYNQGDRERMHLQMLIADNEEAVMGLT